MRYIRKHGQQCLIADDRIKPEDNKDQIQLAPRLEPDIFNNVTRFCLKTDDFMFDFVEGDNHAIDKIVENHHSFVFISRAHNKITVVKYDHVISYDFYLQDPDK
jgi:hypothetical protein